MTEIENLIHTLLTEKSRDIYITANSRRVYLLNYNGDLMYIDGNFLFMDDEEVNRIIMKNLFETLN